MRIHKVENKEPPHIGEFKSYDLVKGKVTSLTRDQTRRLERKKVRSTSYGPSCQKQSSLLITKEVAGPTEILTQGTFEVTLMTTISQQEAEIAT